MVSCAWARCRWCACSRSWGGHAGLGVIGLHDSCGDIRRLVCPEDGALLGADIYYERVGILLGIVLEYFVNLLRQLLVHFAAFILGVVLSVFRAALKALFLVIDRLGSRCALAVAELIALR